MTSAQVLANEQTRKVVDLSNEEVYDRWAETYDTDGNVLQAVDSYTLENIMLPRLLRASQDLLPSRMGGGDKWLVMDLGCGTGRGALKFIEALKDERNRHAVAQLSAKRCRNIHLKGVDASRGMLQVAKNRVPAIAPITEDLLINTEFGLFDVFGEEDADPERAQTVISTLVLEHLPLDLYFKRVSSLLTPGGVLLVTNMHPDMGNATFPTASTTAPGVGTTHPEAGAATRAGFIDEHSNTKYRGFSYAHTLEETKHSARAAGFEMVGPADELKVEEWMLRTDGSSEAEALLGARGKKWIGTNCWFGMMFRLLT